MGGKRKSNDDKFQGLNGLKRTKNVKNQMQCSFCDFQTQYQSSLIRHQKTYYHFSSETEQLKANADLFSSEEQRLKAKVRNILELKISGDVKICGLFKYLGEY